MKITVKMLQGQECLLDVSPDISVAVLKEKVASQLNIPKEEQKLLLMGKPLLDEKLLCDCGIKEGSKLNLVRRARDNQPRQATMRLREAMLAFLLQHMPANNAHQVLEEYMKDFDKSVKSLSIDDLERIARTRLHEAALINN